MRTSTATGFRIARLTEWSVGSETLPVYGAYRNEEVLPRIRFVLAHHVDKLLHYSGSFLPRVREQVRTGMCLEHEFLVHGPMTNLERNDFIGLFGGTDWENLRDISGTGEIPETWTGISVETLRGLLVRVQANTADDSLKEARRTARDLVLAHTLEDARVQYAEQLNQKLLIQAASKASQGQVAAGLSRIMATGEVETAPLAVPSPAPTITPHPALRIVEEPAASLDALLDELADRAIEKYEAEVAGLSLKHQHQLRAETPTMLQRLTYDLAFSLQVKREVAGFPMSWRARVTCDELID